MVNKGGGLMKPKPIYVEIDINRALDDVWTYTQEPTKHVEWDIRFSSIHYEEILDDDVQTFTYKRNISPLLEIIGWGKTKGSVDRDGKKTSSLHFGTDYSFSPIREGRGYWKYEPKGENKTLFITQYDYDVPLGKFGMLLDNYFFRPLLGWSTALSFDVLRRWLEKGESPQTQYRNFIIHWIVTFLFAFIWIYHGLVPKLITQHPLEVQMITDVLPVSYAHAKILTVIAGVGEIAFGLSFLFIQRKGKLFIIALLLLFALGIAAIVGIPSLMTAPFNPFTFNTSLIILALIGWLSSAHLPSAKNCRRVKKRK